MSSTLLGPRARIAENLQASCPYSVESAAVEAVREITDLALLYLTGRLIGWFNLTLSELRPYKTSVVLKLHKHSMMK